MKKISMLRVSTVISFVTLVAFSLIFGLPNNSSGQIVGDPTAQNYNFSNLPADKKMPLTIDKNGIVLGIFRGTSKDGKVLMGDKGPISIGSGLYLGSKEKMFNDSFGATILIPKGNDSYTPMTEKISIGELYYEGTVQKATDAKMIYTGSWLVKPTTGQIGKLTIDGKDIKISKTDLKDGRIETFDGNKYEVFFSSSVGGQWCYLVKIESK